MKKWHNVFGNVRVSQTYLFIILLQIYGIQTNLRNIDSFPSENHTYKLIVIFTSLSRPHPHTYLILALIKRTMRKLTQVNYISECFLAKFRTRLWRVFFYTNHNLCRFSNEHLLEKATKELSIDAILSSQAKRTLFAYLRLGL